MIEIITMDDMIKKDMMKVSSAIYASNYNRNYKNAKILIKVENSVAIVYDDNNNKEIVKFEVIKKRKYSLVGDIETIYNEFEENKNNNKEKDIKQIVSEIIDYVKSFGEIIRLMTRPKDIIFVVEDEGKIEYIDLVDAMFMTFHTGTKKSKIIKEIMTNHIEVIEKREQSEVEDGDFINFIKEINSVGTYTGSVEQVNTLARTVDVIYKSTSGDLDRCTVPFENLVRIKSVKLKNNKPTLNKKEVVGLVKDIMEISKICKTHESNYDSMRVISEDVEMYKNSKGSSIYLTLSNEKYNEDININQIEDAKEICKCSDVIIEIVRNKRQKTITVCAYVEVDYIRNDGSKDDTGVIIEEIVEKMPKNTKQNDENMIKLNKENNYIIEENVGVKPIKKISTNT